MAIAGRLSGFMLRVANRLHLRWILAGVVHRLPPRLRAVATKLQTRLGIMDGLILVPELELERAYRGALELVRETGALTYLEFGVFVGTSMACMYRAAEGEGATIRLVGFDSFEGLPNATADEDFGPSVTWKPGQFHSDLKATTDNLARLGVPRDRVEFVPGWYDTTLTPATRDRLSLERADIVMVDCDLASSARAALDFVTPLIADRTVIFFDDWHWGGLADRGLGERRAFDEWRASNPEFTAEELPQLKYADKSHAFMVSRLGVNSAATAVPGTQRPLPR